MLPPQAAAECILVPLPGMLAAYATATACGAQRASIGECAKTASTSKRQGRGRTLCFPLARWKSHCGLVGTRPSRRCDPCSCPRCSSETASKSFAALTMPLPSSPWSLSWSSLLRLRGSSIRRRSERGPFASPLLGQVTTPLSRFALPQVV